MKVTIETNLGTLSIQLLPDVAPHYCAHFLRLARAGFYVGIPFFRVVKGFMVQTGFNGHRLASYAPQPNPGSGVCPDEYPGAEVVHQRGFLNVPNAGRNTQNSGWCIFDGPALWLTGKHTVFAVLIDGYDVLDRIAAVPVHAVDGWFNGERSKPEADDAAVVTAIDTGGADLLTLPSATATAAASYHLVIRTTRGTLGVSLFHEAAPRSVAHLVRVIRDFPSFFRRNPFHRISRTFVLQTGQTPAALGHRQIPFAPADERTRLAHGRGSVSIVPGTQAQLCFFAQACARLDADDNQGDNVIGVVTEGFAVLDDLLAQPVGASPLFVVEGQPELSAPLGRVEILDIEVHEMSRAHFAAIYEEN